MAKILIWADSPTSHTGFATVTRNLSYHFKEAGHEVSILGINHSGYYDQQKFPYKIEPAYTHLESFAGTADMKNDPFGRKKLSFMLAGNYPSDDFLEMWDVVLTIQDVYNCQQLAKDWATIKKYNEKLKWIAYFPIDSHSVPGWETIVSIPDEAVYYTRFGREEMQGAIDRGLAQLKVKPKQDEKDKAAIQLLSKHSGKVIYHGTNTKDFYPVDEEEIKKFRKEYFGVPENTFVVTNVNRNQQRKDIMRTMVIFKEFKKKVPKSILYLHMKQKDLGGDLGFYAHLLGMKYGEDVIWPDQKSGHATIEQINLIYNSSDAFLTTTLGEGWGLTITEAMATLCPVVAPKNTSIPEILGDNKRGWVVPCTNPVGLTSGDLNRVRYQMDVEPAVNALLEIYNNPDEADKRCRNAINWVENISWEQSARDFMKLFPSKIIQLNK